MGGKLVFLYPGQGAQKVGMGYDLYCAHTEARRLYDNADCFLGFSLSRLSFEGPEEELDRDLNAQLAVYTISCILTDLLREYDFSPEIVAGYSSGFYAAAYAAGCFDFIEGLSLVKRAGEIILEESQRVEGRMGVVFGLPYDKVDDVCRRVGDVQIAIVNTPRQIIVSGIESSIEKAADICLQEGALDAYILPIFAPYHSGFVGNCSPKFLGAIQNMNLRNPKVPLMSYLSLEYVMDAQELMQVMAAQLSGPVLWADLISKIRNSDPKSFFFEIGPGGIIKRTVRWIDRKMKILNVGTEQELLTIKMEYDRQSRKAAY